MEWRSDECYVAMDQHSDDCRVAMDQRSDDCRVAMDQHIDDCRVVMDQPSDDSPCKRLRVSEGNYIDEETGMVIDGNMLQEGAASRVDGLGNTTREGWETTDANIPNTSDRIVTVLPRTGPSILDRSLPGVLHITKICGDQSVANTESEDSGALSTGSTYRNQSEGSLEMGKQSADRIQTCFQLENGNVATCAGIDVSKLDDATNMDSFNDTTNTDFVKDATKLDIVNPEPAGNAPKQELNTGICDYVQNIQAVADNSYPRLRENTCVISTYDRNTSLSKSEYVPNLESPKLKRTLDRANTNLAKKRMESVIDSAVVEVKNSKILVDSQFKEVCRREYDRAEPGSCSVNNGTENEKGDCETESKLEEPVKHIESGAIFRAGPESEESHEANFNVHSHTSMKVSAVDTIETDERIQRSVDFHRNNREKIVRQWDISENTGQVSSDMHENAKKEPIAHHKDLDENIIMHSGTYKELIQNHSDFNDNKNNNNASGSGIIPPENMNDSGSSLTWNYGKKSQTGRISQRSWTLSRKAVTDSRETNPACSFGDLNNLLEDISGGNVNEVHDKDLVRVANKNNTLDESLTFVPSTSAQNRTSSQSSSSPTLHSRLSSKSSMCSQSSASSRSSANGRICSELNSSLRSNTSVFTARSSGSTTLQTPKETLGVTASTSDINTASFQTFCIPTATPNTSTCNLDRTDSLAFNDTDPTDLYQVSNGVEAHIHVPQCSALKLDGVNTEEDSKESAEDEQGLILIDERLKLDFNHVRDSVLDTNKDLRESGKDKHGLAHIDGHLKLDFDQTQEIISQNNINSLPIIVLLKILKHLTVFELLCRASLVCKYWYNLCRDPDIWRNVYLANQDRLTDEDLIRLLMFGEHRVRNMNLTDCRFLTDYGFKYLLRNCLQIEVLRVMRCFDLTDLAFKGLHRKGRCSKLYSLHLDGCFRTGTKALFELSEACPRMRDLHLNQCMVCDAGITPVARRCPNLVNLQLDHCTLVTDDALSEIVLGCPGMMHLNLMSCSITDRGVKYLSKLLKLRNVDLSNLLRMSSDSVIYMSRFCKDLQSVNVSLNTAIDDDCIAQLAHNLPMLKKLYCVSCSISDKGLQDIAKYRPTIEKLDVSWCQEITDHGVRVISLACNHLDYFGLIRCDRVSVETIEELLFRYPRINYSTFFLESRKLLDRARSEGYTFNLPAFKLRNSQKV